MTTSSAGSRAAWFAHSRKVHSDLAAMFGGNSITKLNYELGERIRHMALDCYERWRREGMLLVEYYSTENQLQLAACRELGSRIKGDANIFLQDAERRGTYRSPVEEVSRHLIDLLRYDGNCIYLSTDTGQAGVLLDYEVDSASGFRYELEAWG